MSSTTPQDNKPVPDKQEKQNKLNTERNKAAASNSKNNKLGTFGGVFTPTILTILGVIMFMRANFVIGETGILGAIFILCLAKSITLLTSLSISAIATNMQVRGGGSYFLISRVLGPEFGGAIGVSLFVATALSAPFYIIGFMEALALIFPAVTPYALPISIAVAITIFVVAYVGAEWATRVQYFIMSILVLAIAVFMTGSVLQFSPEQFLDNWTTGYTPVFSGDLLGPKYSFWIIFAIYFPAVTGIDAGLNMSGDLKNPAESLPKGTLIAVLVGFLVYLSQILLSGGAYPRQLLIDQPFNLLVDNAFLGLGAVVVAGVFSATLSSALGSTLGAPRVLQALARDPILSALKPFAKGSDEKDEPQRALFFSSLITVTVLCWAYISAGGDALNAIAAIITMFFLYTYGMINLAAFTEAFGRNPSFRPRFKLFHWLTALIGGVGCVFAAFLIDFLAAAVAAICILVLIVYLQNKKTTATFGDARRGFVYSSARKNLLQLGEMPEDAKNWRPTMMVFSGNPNNRESLVTFALWLGSGRGITILVDILLGKVEQLKNHRKNAIKRLKDFCHEKRIQAFPMVFVGESVETGVLNALQLAGSGVITPNLMVIGWCDAKKNLGSYMKQIREAKALGMSVAIIKADWLPMPAWRKKVHIWWRGNANGHLMMLLGFLMKDNWEWGKTKITVFRSVTDNGGIAPAQKNLDEIIERSRIDAQSAVVVSGSKPFKEVLVSHSEEADCVFLGFQPPEPENEAQWYSLYKSWLDSQNACILISSSIDEDLLA
ncbi:MAG: amino acid permease [Cyanobacteria bacterium P01_H01_bin.74]